jgi:hypothetical protein
VQISTYWPMRSIRSEDSPSPAIARCWASRSSLTRS